MKKKLLLKKKILKISLSLLCFKDNKIILITILKKIIIEFEEQNTYTIFSIIFDFFTNFYIKFFLIIFFYKNK